MKILLLEDDLHRIEQFKKRVDELNERNTHKEEPFELIHFEDAEPCIAELNKGSLFHLILLDHDLGGKVYVDAAENNTGSEVARWLNAHYDFKTLRTVVLTHTLNGPGAENIITLIPDAIHVPFVWQEKIFHTTIKVN
jgi:hypothetical protein